MALTVWENVTVTGQYAGLVASSWKGQTYLRSAPAKVNNNSPKQQNHKSLYKSLYDFISPCYQEGIKPFLNPPKMTATNLIIKSQDPRYWKQTLNTNNKKTYVYNNIKFPQTELIITPNVTYEYITTDKSYLKINSIEITGNDADKILKYHVFFCNKIGNISYYEQTNINDISKLYPVYRKTGDAGYIFLIWFTTSNKLSSLYFCSGGKIFPTPDNDNI